MVPGPELVEIIGGGELFDPSLDMPGGIANIGGELIDDFRLEEDVWFPGDVGGGDFDDGPGPGR